MLQQAADTHYDAMSEIAQSFYAGRGLILPCHIDRRLRRYLLLCSRAGAQPTALHISHAGRRAAGHARFKRSAEPVQACGSPQYEQQRSALLLVSWAVAGLCGLSRLFKMCVPCCSSPIMADRYGRAQDQVPFQLPVSDCVNVEGQDQSAARV